MKTLSTFLMLAVCFANIATAQNANTSLSNLVATSINQTLQPNTNNSFSLGTQTLSWKNLYLRGSFFLNGKKMWQYKTGVNTIIGEGAGGTGTGGFNTAFGTNVLSVNTTGNSNVAIGEYSLQYNTTGNNNTATGYAALLNNTEGYDNTANGFQSLLTNTTGIQNTATGFYAMKANTSGNYNTAHGYQTLYSNTTGYANTALGIAALNANTTGHDNTGNGNVALYNNTTGSNNTAIGDQSLYSNTTGSNNTALGYNAGVSAGNWTNATAIGANAIVGNNNSLVLGNNANVGIGTSVPFYKLSVQSTVVEANNNTSLLSLTGRNPVVAFNDENNTSYGYIKSITNAPNPGYTTGMEFGTSPGYSIFFSTNYSPTMIIANSGNVGIGTSNPTYKLSVNGTIRSKEVRVETGWSDYVFDKDYKLLSLKNVEKYIEQNKHLPGIPSAKEIQDNGLAVGDVQAKMMAKIEELTLYIIEQQKSINNLMEQNARLETKINSLVIGGK